MEPFVALLNYTPVLQYNCTCTALPVVLLVLKHRFVKCLTSLIILEPGHTILRDGVQLYILPGMTYDCVLGSLSVQMTFSVLQWWNVVLYRSK